MEVFVTLVVQLAMGIFGGQMISANRKWEDIRQTVKITAGGAGGLVLGQVVGMIVGNENSFFAMLGDAGGGLAGGAIATAIIVTIIRKLRGR
ncbi:MULTISPECIES: hypothetical protein [Actibacterium]|uniref:Transglycosylase associated protein n=1 Tax=Actibacterium naphthalenivorans TaxID=1614693 RepID=A0A840C907_9RHOB|nr:MULTISPECIES: hypothetical protein [Actibacterium]ALG91127.1 hypothetical protein TQ29_14200 [Actibacterium sp. EMB200-NS6]MBB4022474.1 hypothetical protein [Actibacterium naphthalenivorans]